ncbi:MAG: hypothetical protein IKF47_01860 [Bacilli bacterium]|nr:hypothetical protein [Bacilli bacterium]
MKKRIKILIAFVALAFSLSIISTTYSRYVADANGDVALTFAKWQILVNDADITSGNVESIDITPTIVENENVASGKLAPSSLGYYDIEIDVSNVETSFDMHITLDNEDMADLRITSYSIDDGEEIEIEDGQIDESFDYDEDLETINIRIYFEWYDVDDGDSEMDNEDDTEFVSNNEEITITTNLSFEQRID